MAMPSHRRKIRINQNRYGTAGTGEKRYVKVPSI
jgi:hypothetical protein